MLFRSQVNVSNGQIVFGSVPALTGAYGQFNKSLRLPQIIKSTWSSHPLESRWTPNFGVITFDNANIFWGGFDYQFSKNQYSFKTYELNNLFISYSRKDFIFDKLDFEIVLGSDIAAKKNQMYVGKLKYAF